MQLNATSTISTARRKAAPAPFTANEATHRSRVWSARALPEAAAVALSLWNWCNQESSCAAGLGCTLTRPCQPMCQLAAAPVAHPLIEPTTLQAPPPSSSTVAPDAWQPASSRSSPAHTTLTTRTFSFSPSPFFCLLIGQMPASQWPATASPSLPNGASTNSPQIGRVKGMGACAELQDCGPAVPQPQSTGTRNQGAKPDAEGSVAQEGGATPSFPALPAAEHLSEEARGFLRDGLDAELRERGRELVEAAWQALE